MLHIELDHFVAGAAAGIRHIDAYTQGSVSSEWGHWMIPLLYRVCWRLRSPIAQTASRSISLEKVLDRPVGPGRPHAAPRATTRHSAGPPADACWHSGHLQRSQADPQLRGQLAIAALNSAVERRWPGRW